ncbi:hypothetical protein DFAR_3170013 [Desulfarculales bacterium]
MGLANPRALNRGLAEEWRCCFSD